MGMTLANKITVCRILAVPFFIAAILDYSPQEDYHRFIALGIFLFAVISDLVDGYVARKWKQQTKAGAILDPLADKILLIFAFVFLYFINDRLPLVKFPAWLVVWAIGRDVILIFGVTIVSIFQGVFEIKPTKWGKATTFAEVMSVLAVLLQWQFLSIFWYIALILIIGSTIDYMRKGIKMLNHGEGL
ncbi:MAG: CDP-alcohol phosphatidyltransferase family protein [Candidatus Omnitrophica bacterium]|nr:CDP-alcohol phosphatidyltransferase family protein [Candidatus Omnitrophota bacterium]